MSLRPTKDKQAVPDADTSTVALSTEASSESDAKVHGDAYVIAQAIDKAGMGGVASLALEIGKPLHWLGGQVAWMLEPFLGTFRPFSSRGSMPIKGIARLLESPDGAAELAAQLEELSGKQPKGGGTR